MTNNLTSLATPTMHRGFLSRRMFHPGTAPQHPLWARVVSISWQVACSQSNKMVEEEKSKMGKEGNEVKKLASRLLTALAFFGMSHNLYRSTSQVLTVFFMD